MKAIYMDYAATTPMDADVAKALFKYETEVFGNPSSIHYFGRLSRKEVAAARSKAAKLIGADSEEIFFTSGGSESDNWAIKGIAFEHRHRGKHIITTGIEHHAVLNTCGWLEKQGFEVTYLPAGKNGLISARDVEKALRPDTILVSVMLANNETGIIQPVAEIGELLKDKNILFHTDAVQAVGHIPVNVKELNADVMSASAHKFYGPKGMGFLYIRRGTKLTSLIHGGAQERGLRGGTENTPGIIGLGLAAEKAEEELLAEGERLKQLRAKLEQGIMSIGEKYPSHKAWINGIGLDRLPGHLSFRFKGISSDVMLIRLDMAGFAVSAGSACSAGSIEPSHVLVAMGQDEAQANSTIRVSLGKFNTEEDISNMLEALDKIVSEL